MNNESNNTRDAAGIRRLMSSYSFKLTDDEWRVLTASDEASSDLGVLLSDVIIDGSLTHNIKYGQEIYFDVVTEKRQGIATVPGIVRDFLQSQNFHYFAASMDTWVTTETSITQAKKKLRNSSKKDCMFVLKVPVPYGTEYDIKFFVPDVPGLEILWESKTFGAIAHKALSMINNPE